LLDAFTGEPGDVLAARRGVVWTDAGETNVHADALGELDLETCPLEIRRIAVRRSLQGAQWELVAVSQHGIALAMG